MTNRSAPKNARSAPLLMGLAPPHPGGPDHRQDDDNIDEDWHFQFAQIGGENQIDNKAIGDEGYQWPPYQGMFFSTINAAM